MRLYSYAMHTNSVLFDALIALRCVLCADVVKNCWRECVWGLVTHVHVFEGDGIPPTLRGATTTLYRSWREGELRGIVWCSCGFRSVCRWTMSSVVRFALDIRWKDSNSGRTELDLGLVCSMRRGLQPEVCCVVLYCSLLVLPWRDCWSEDHCNLSFCLEGWRMTLG